MFAATFFFLGIGGLFLLASLCLLDEKAAATSNSTRNWSQKPTWHKRAKWPEIKAAWTQWYVQCQKREAPRRKTLLSWGRTMALCAAICIVGVFLKVELDEQVSASRIWSSFKHSHSVAHHTWQFKPSWSTPIPATNQSTQK